MKENESLLQTDEGSFSTFGTVVNTEKLTIDSDIYGILSPTNSKNFIKNEANILGQRVLMEFLFLQYDKQETASTINEVEILSLYKILTKEAVFVSAEESQEKLNQTFGSASISITYANISKAFLNIQYEIEGKDENIPHDISLLVEDNASLDKDGLLWVELRHNPGNDLQENPFWGVVSFSLSSIPQYQQAAFKGLRILYKNKKGDNEYTTVTLK